MCNLNLKSSTLQFQAIGDSRIPREFGIPRQDLQDPSLNKEALHFIEAEARRMYELAFYHVHFAKVLK